MNLRDSFRGYKLVILVLLVLGLGIALANERSVKKPKWSFETEKEKEDVLAAIQEAIDDRTLRKLKEIKYEEFSPDQSKKIILYKTAFDPGLYNNYYVDYFYNREIIAVRDIEDQREEYIFTGEERTGDPHWLGNNYVFFTAYCGTACKGLYLIDTRDKETWLAVLSHIFSCKRDVHDTHFKDWFGQEFVFEGLISEIESEMMDDKAYLIFRMKDGEGNFLYEKRFLFTGDELKALN